MLFANFPSSLYIFVLFTNKLKFLKEKYMNQQQKGHDGVDGQMVCSLLLFPLSCTDSEFTVYLRVCARVEFYRNKFDSWTQKTRKVQVRQHIYNPRFLKPSKMKIQCIMSILKVPCKGKPWMVIKILSKTQFCNVLVENRVKISKR